MKATFILTALICLSGLASNAQEIKRPTAEMSSSSLAYGCTGQNQSSSAMPNAYDAAGQSTSSSMTVTGGTSQTFLKARVFFTWQSTGNTYSTLSLNVNWSSSETTTGSVGQVCLAYSIDGGNTWSSIACNNAAAQGTSTISLSSTQALAQLKVAACVQGTAGGDTQGSTDTITIWDVWTLGTVSGQIGGSGSGAGQPHRGAVPTN